MTSAPSTPAPSDMRMSLDVSASNRPSIQVDHTTPSFEFSRDPLPGFSPRSIPPSVISIPYRNASITSLASLQPLVRTQPPSEAQPEHQEQTQRQDAYRSTTSGNSFSQMNAQGGPVYLILTPETASDSTAREAGSTAKAWSECARAMIEYDAMNVRRWKDEIDTLLVVAGLFSAIVTAFVIESYKSLRPEPSEAIVRTLERISPQLYNVSEVEPPASTSDAHFVPGHIALLINCLWFASLALSLAVAFIGLTVKQWLGEYTAGLRSMPRCRGQVSMKQARARQRRHDALSLWKVHVIRNALPAILLFSIILFFVGIVRLFIAIHRALGALLGTLLGSVVAFALFTSAAPIASESCPYRSPQALIFFYAAQRTISVWNKLTKQFTDNADRSDGTESKLPEPCTSSYQFRTSGVSSQASTKCISQGRRTYSTFKEREEAALLKSTETYKGKILDEYDRIKMDTTLIRDTVRPCLRTLALNDALWCMWRMLSRRTEEENQPEWDADLDDETVAVFVDIVLDLLERRDLAEDLEISDDMLKQHVSPNYMVDINDTRVYLLELLKRFFTRHQDALLENTRLVPVLAMYRRHATSDLVEGFVAAAPQAMLATCAHTVQLMTLPPAQADGAEASLLTQLSDIVELVGIVLSKDRPPCQVSANDVGALDAFFGAIESFVEGHSSLLSSQTDYGRRWREVWAAAHQALVIKYLGSTYPNTTHMTDLAARISKITDITEGEHNQAGGIEQPA